MSEIAEAARRHDDAFNAHDPAARRETEAPDIHVVLPGGIELDGTDQTVQFVSVFWDALPDANLSSSSALEQADTIAIEGTLSGHHTGTFRTPQAEIPPTQNPVTLRYASFKTIREGKVADERLYFDQLEFLQQLGALPKS